MQTLEINDYKPELIPISSDEIELNMGPHHPATHGVIRIVLKMDGEIVRSAKPDVGYLHRSIEKIGEMVTYAGFMPYTDRVDYLASVNCNVGYALAVEKMAQIEVPERAQYLRVIGNEMIRISSHLLSLGIYTMDIGAFTPLVHAFREREVFNDLMEMMAGARLTHNYARLGGVYKDVTDGFFEKMEKQLDHFDNFLVEFDKLISFNQIFVQRNKNIGIISAEDAISYSFSGPNLRASGVNFDIRKAEPYLVYDKLDFDIPVGRAIVGTLGDSFDRYYLRIEEMKQSSRIIRQAMSQMPDGEIQSKISKKFVPPAGEIYMRTEAPRGELGYYIISDGKSVSPARIKIRTGSFTAMTALEYLLPGMMIADVVAFFSSIDVVAPEIDR